MEIGTSAQKLRGEEGGLRDKAFYDANPFVRDRPFVTEEEWLSRCEATLKGVDEIASIAGKDRPPPQAAPCSPVGSNVSHVRRSIDVEAHDTCADENPGYVGNNEAGDFGDDEDSDDSIVMSVSNHFEIVSARNDACVDVIDDEYTRADVPSPHQMHLMLLPFDPNTPILDVIANIFAGKMKFKHFEWIMAYRAHIMDTNMTLAGHAKGRRMAKDNLRTNLTFVSGSKDDSLCSTMQALHVEHESAGRPVADHPPIVVAARAATKVAGKGQSEYAWEGFVWTRCRELLSNYSYLITQVRVWQHVTFDNLIAVCGKRGKMRQSLVEGKKYFEGILNHGKTSNLISIGQYTIVELYETILIPAMCATAFSVDESEVTNGKLLMFRSAPASAFSNKQHSYDVADVIASKFSSQAFLPHYEVAEAVPIATPYCITSDEERQVRFKDKSSSFFGQRDERGNLTDAAGLRRKRSAKMAKMLLFARQSDQTLSPHRPSNMDKVGAAILVAPMFATPSDIGGTKFDPLFARKLIVDADDRAILATSEKAFKKNGLLQQLFARITNTLSSSRSQHVFADLTEDLVHERSRVRRLYARFQDMAYGDISEGEGWMPVDKDEDEDDDGGVQLVPV